MAALPTLEISQKDSPGVNFLYRTLPGRMVLRLLICPGISKAAGFFLDRRISRFLIGPFIRTGHIPMDDYEKVPYISFNDFFTRQVRPGLRALPEDFAVPFAPCDGKLTAYPITEDARFHIKHSTYDLSQLLGDASLAEAFRGGTCLIFRLTPDDYHRYVFPDSGRQLCCRKIPGVLHTVRPIAFDRYPVYTQNAREYALLETEHFGSVIQMEVGALFVGRIVNRPVSGPFHRGQEKGMFQFGGSTIVLLFQKDAVEIDPIFFENTHNNRETIVKMGCPLGKRTTT